MDAGQCVTPWTLSLESDLCKFVPFSHLRQPPSTLDAPGRFENWVAQGTLRSPAPGESLWITTDGSFLPELGKAGWGLVVSAGSANAQAEQSFLGCCWGSLKTMTDICQGIAGPLDAFQAEIVGIFWAGVAVMQLHAHQAVYFRCDNQAALGIAEGIFQHANLPVLQATRALHQYVSIRARYPPAYVHVHGHCGDTANELADALAQYAANVECESGPFSLDLPQWFQQEGKAFGWAAHALWSRACQVEGPQFEHGILVWDRQQPALCVPPEEVLEPFMPSCKDQQDRPMKCSSFLCLGVATYNCLSIIDKDKALQTQSVLRQVGRAKLLADSLSHEKVHLAGIQETRQSSGCYRCGSFGRIASGWDCEGNFGVELWYDSEASFAWMQERPVFLHQANFTVLHATPTSLIVKLSHQAFEATILVAHAPHRAHTEQMRSAWWTALLAKCASFDDGGAWIVLADANCRLGSLPSDSIGSWARDDEDLSGMYLHTLMERLRLFVPTTFEDHTSGPPGTVYMKRSSMLARGDYVGLPLDWKTQQVHAYTAPSVSSGHQVLDHIAVVAQARVEIPAQWSPAKLKRCSTDAHALLEPSNQSAVRHIIARIPAVPWTVSVHEHCAVLIKHLQQELSAAFIVQQKKFRADYFSTRTKSLHSMLRAKRGKLRHRCQALRWTRLRCAFLQWARKESRIGLASCLTGAWLAELRLCIAMDAEQIGQLSRLLRSSCRADKLQKLEQLAADVGSVHPSDVQIACRKLLQPRKKRAAGHETVWPRRAC